MIDTMIGRAGQRPVQSSDDLAPPIKSRVSSFGDMSDKMRIDAAKLKRIADEDIPRAFPLSPPRGNSEPGFKHTQYEFMGSRFNTEIDDGLFAIDVIEQIYTIGEGAQLILNSLFPNSFNTGAWKMEIPDQFEHAKATLNDGIDAVKTYLEELRDLKQPEPSMAIDLKEMDRLKKHFIRIGQEFVTTGKIPVDLLARNGLKITPERVARELRKSTMQDNGQEMMLMEPTNEPENDANDNGESLLSERLFRQINKNSNYR